MNNYHSIMNTFDKGMIMLDVKEICKKLKPLIGQQADCYWLAYLTEDLEGKKEIADMLQVMDMQLLDGLLIVYSTPITVRKDFQSQ